MQLQLFSGIAFVYSRYPSHSKLTTVIYLLVYIETLPILFSLFIGIVLNFNKCVNNAKKFKYTIFLNMHNILMNLKNEKLGNRFCIQII